MIKFKKGFIVIIGILVLSVPMILGFIFASLNGAKPLLFFIPYLLFSQMYPIKWFLNYDMYYEAKNCKVTIENKEINIKANELFKNPWQLLLYPMHIDTTDVKQVQRIFKSSGLKAWEGLLASFFCGFGLQGDLFDDFNEIYGTEINYQEIMFQFLIKLVYNLSFAFSHFYWFSRLSGYFFGILACVQFLGIIFFYYFENYRFKKLNLPTQTYRHRYH